MSGVHSERQCFAAPLPLPGRRPLPHRGEYRRSSCMNGRYFCQVADSLKYLTFNTSIIVSYVRALSKQKLNAFKSRSTAGIYLEAAALSEERSRTGTRQSR